MLVLCAGIACRIAGASVMKPDSTNAHVIVIGGGIAGLTAANYLAREGVRVTLFERASRLGGQAASRHEDGWTINRGSHALYPGGAASAAFKAFGVSYRYGTPTATYTLHQDRFRPLPSSPFTFAQARLAPRDTLALLRFFASLPRLSARSLASLSVQTWLEQTVKRPRIRDLVAGIARPFVYSAALDLVSAEVFIDKLQRVLRHPVQYIEGGWQTLVDALQHQAEYAGVRIVAGTRAEAVEQANGQIEGVRLADGHFLKATAVIIATRPKEAARLLEKKTALRALVDALVPAHVACLDVALQGLEVPKHPVVFDLDKPRFLTTQSLYVKVAPQGGTLLSAFKLLDPREPIDPKANERDLEALINHVQPGWRPAVVKRNSLPHIEAVGALPLAREGGFAGRPKSQVPDLANCYLAGDWVGDEGFLIDASVASARQAARHILRTASVSAESLVLEPA